MQAHGSLISVRPPISLCIRQQIIPIQRQKGFSSGSEMETEVHVKTEVEFQLMNSLNLFDILTVLSECT